MPVYILIEGQSNVFKIGSTGGAIEDRIHALQTGNSQPLTVFDAVETDQESACEAFFHRRLRSKRVGGGGGWDFFQLDADEMRHAIENFKRMFAEPLEARQAVGDLIQQSSDDRLLEPTASDRELLDQLMRNKEEQEFLQFECELIESKLKQRIGTASGIRGLATWKTQVTKCYDEKLLMDSDPDRYNDLLEQYYCLDSTAWKSDRPYEYRSIQTTYYTPRVSRVFRPQKSV